MEFDLFLKFSAFLEFFNVLRYLLALLTAYFKSGFIFPGL